MIAASLSLADIPGSVRLWRQRRFEFLLLVTAFLGVALLGVLEGIAVAVALSILNVFRRAWRPYQTTLGRVPGVAGYHDRRLHPDGEAAAGPGDHRFDAPLFFANSRTFRDQVRQLAAIRPASALDPGRRRADHRRGHDRGGHARRARRAAQRAGDLAVFAELKDPVRAKLERYELIGPLDPDHFFPTLEAAVDSFREQTGADWTAPAGRASPQP